MANRYGITLDRAWTARQKAPSLRVPKKAEHIPEHDPERAMKQLGGVLRLPT